MKAAIEVKNRAEADAVKAAMEDPATRASTLIVGYLLGVKNKAKRALILKFAGDLIELERLESDETPLGG